MGRAISGAVLAIAILLVLPMEHARAQEGQPVQEIVFQGNNQYGESTLKHKIRSKEGHRFSDAKLAEDVSTLLAFFARVTTKCASSSSSRNIRTSSPR